MKVPWGPSYLNRNIYLWRMPGEDLMVAAIGIVGAVLLFSLRLTTFM